LNLLSVRHVLQLDVTLVSQVSCSFGLLESVVPDSCSLSVWESAGGSDAGQHASNVVSEGGGRAENGGAKSTHRVTPALVIHVQSLEFVEAFGGGYQKRSLTLVVGSCLLQRLAD